MSKLYEMIQCEVACFDKNNVKFCVCVGEDELAQKSVWVKDLETKEETMLSIDAFKE